MHWIWRTTIGVLAGCGYAVASIALFEGVHQRIVDQLEMALGDSSRSDWRTGLAVSISYFLPALVLAFAAYGLTTRLFRHSHIDHETRCRKCSYILRGITEPRCPECGERI